MNIKINGFNVEHFLRLMDPVEKNLLEKSFKSKQYIMNIFFKNYSKNLNLYFLKLKIVFFLYNLQFNCNLNS